MEITSITVVLSDGSIVTTSGPFTPVNPPTPVEIADVKVENTDGTSEELVPETPVAPTE